MMNKKLFRKIYIDKKGLNELELEDEINSWLEKNPDIKIIDIKQSSCVG